MADDELRKLRRQMELITRPDSEVGKLRARLDEITSSTKWATEAARLANPPSIPSSVWSAIDKHAFGPATQQLLAGSIGGLNLPDVSSLNQMLNQAENAMRPFAARFDELQRIGVLANGTEIHQALKLALAAKTDYDHLFRFAEMNEVGRLASSSLGAGSIAALAFGDHEVSALQAAMSAMQSPWLKIDHTQASAQAFADIQAIGRMISDGPFDLSVASALRSSLGDWRDPISLDPQSYLNPLHRLTLYSERGFDLNLTDFTEEAFDRSLESSRLLDTETDGGQFDNDRDAGLARSRQAFAILQDFENSVRRFIESVMTDKFGESWMLRRLPNGMLEEWKQKRDKAIATGEPEAVLIDYADFTDYKKIIERRDNWREVFSGVFGRPEDVGESFQRLYPIRNPTSHCRIVTNADRLLLVVETRRVLRAIRKA